MNGEGERPIRLTVNGESVAWNGDATVPLADVLRDGQGLTGTKIGCRTGECGACTVLLDGRPVVSCLVPVASAQDQRIETVEGLASNADFQALARSMEQHGGVQCGFCTPGIMVALWAWLQDPERFGGDVRSALKNNLCRCTGYLGMMRAAEQVAAQRGETR
ncbi:(2Fe-2S)-binding protein [Cohnella thermotolerans]|jgi:aerobic-type carbon monoxide dehydrogenase small subunit (CoxS/CutS family)|uniref:(2Fe-2S)-binding protein n=1 Tax=Cohnella thermotolerans TaxID=329858 RepID=UPI0003F8D9E2|nr:2Fe-2S iron-sulfur cluster-binding protein [Cohnella thermotolerans]